MTRLSGMVYDPLQREFCLKESDVGVNYLLAATKAESY